MRPDTTGNGGVSLTVHQLLRQLAPEYWKRFGPAMPQRHRQVLRKILSCRTPALGGELFQCPDCPGFDYRYHSCNDRHCPLCGQTDANDWLQRQRQRLLLPVPYFMVTFTVPEELRSFIRSHQQVALDLLFAASSRALQDLAANPRRLGAQLGMLGVLHTWSRTLIYHPHIHYLVPGGGLSPDGRRWVSAKKYLLSHEALGDRCVTYIKLSFSRNSPNCSNKSPPRSGAGIGTSAAWQRVRARMPCVIWPVTCSKAPPPTNPCSCGPTARCGGIIATAKPANPPRSHWIPWSG